MRIPVIAILVALVISFSAAELPGQSTTDIAELFKRFQNGEAVEGELDELARSKQADAKTRFNAVYLLAVGALSANDPKLALERLNRAETIQPETAQVAVRRAEALLLSKKLPSAAKALKKAKSKLASKKKSALYRRHQIVAARVDAASGKFKQAVSRLESLSKRHKKNWEIHFFLGCFLEAQDKPKGALENFDSAISFLPERDPCLGVYALQRWPALAVSSNKNSYTDQKLLKRAIKRYDAFLARAKANRVPAELVTDVQRAVGALKMFSKPRR